MGRYLLNMLTPSVLNIPRFHFIVFIIEDIPDTYMIANQRTSPLRFTMAIQKDPSLKNTTSDLNRRGIYYDVGYEYNEFKTSILFKARFLVMVAVHPINMLPYSSGLP